MKRIRNKSISWKLIINNIINNKYNEINNKTKSDNDTEIRDNDTEISDNISLVGNAERLSIYNVLLVCLCFNRVITQQRRLIHRK